jgi:hypothetical protein
MILLIIDLDTQYRETWNSKKLPFYNNHTTTAGMEIKKISIG